MSTPIVGDTLLAAILAVLSKILIFMIASRFIRLAFKALLFAVAAATFYELVIFTSAQVSTYAGIALAQMIGQGGLLGDGLVFFGCMLPANIADAFTTLLYIYLTAGMVKLARIFLVAQATGA